MSHVHARDEAPGVEAEFQFTPPAYAHPDPGRPGFLRAIEPGPHSMDGPYNAARHRCEVLDCSGPGGFRPDLVAHGFGHAELAALTELQRVLEAVRRAGRVRDDQAREIRRSLVGRSIPLAGGRRLRILFIAPEGFIMRRAGPNGMPLQAAPANLGMNDHGPALGVHADQNVDGTPVRQLLRRLGPRLFRHDSPGHANRRSPLFLLNLWIPLDQVTRPLALMDRRHLDRRRHQLAYALPTDTFLQRGEDQRLNDIWTFLHDPAQRWVYTSEMDARRGYVFDTLSTPHASTILPGEDVAEARYRALTDALDRHAAGERVGAAELEPLEPDEATPSPLRRRIAEVETCLLEAPAALGGEGAATFATRAREAADRLIRKSLEMRLVGIVTPWRDIRP